MKKMLKAIIFKIFYLINNTFLYLAWSGKLTETPNIILHNMYSYE